MTNAYDTIDTTRPKNMLQLINERDNIPLKILITKIQRMTKHFQNKGTNIQKDGTEIEKIKHRFPFAPSYKTKNLTDEIITKEEYNRGYKNILKS